MLTLIIGKHASKVVKGRTLRDGFILLLTGPEFAKALQGSSIEYFPKQVSIAVEIECLTSQSLDSGPLKESGRGVSTVVVELIVGVLSPVVVTVALSPVRLLEDVPFGTHGDVRSHISL